MTEPQILVEELEKRFGDTAVLKGVNMRVERSEVAVISGSGAGKTTLLRVLIGLGAEHGSVWSRDRLGHCRSAS